MKNMRKVLIANRGEIAERIIRTCDRLGLVTVVVHSTLDSRQPFVAAAGEAIELGPTSAESYLDGAAIIAAAQEVRADAIHPGYGFLSENAAFAQAVIDAGLIFIGPRPEVIDQLGRKDRAREIAARAGVPVTEQYPADGVPHEAYPVLVKAASGGGGKGMHIVEQPDGLAAAVETAGREAAAAFGDDTLLIERFITRGRHIEVQVFGDEHGNVVHLFERDCSVQRRHQKIIEEAPAPKVSPKLRQLLHDSAVALCRETGYTNAGTVEFLVDGDEAWFLEMNTRLQVEHPVTEAITGLDLVEWQLLVADGQELPLPQNQITCEGHALEVRVYAEDPYTEFLPQAGLIRRIAWPEPPVRVEAGIAAGTEVGTNFDPMLAKIITHGVDREEATTKMVAALDATAVLGITTNIGFVRGLLASDEFANSAIHTSWLDERGAGAKPECPPTVLAEAANHLAGVALGTVEADGWRSAGPAAVVQVPVQPEGGDLVRTEPASTTRLPAVVSGPRVWIAAKGQSWLIHKPDGMRKDSSVSVDGPVVHAPMPGTVLVVDAQIGQRVQTGDRLGVMEAMKMELALDAPVAGTLKSVPNVGTQVSMGQTLFEIEEDDD